MHFLSWDIFQIMQMAAPKKYWEAKNKHFLISTSNCQRYTKFNFKYMFLGIKNTMKLLNNNLPIAKDLKLQNGHRFEVLCEFVEN